MNELRQAMRRMQQQYAVPQQNADTGAQGGGAGYHQSVRPVGQPSLGAYGGHQQGEAGAMVSGPTAVNAQTQERLRTQHDVGTPVRPIDQAQAPMGAAQASGMGTAVDEWESENGQPGSWISWLRGGQ